MTTTSKKQSLLNRIFFNTPNQPIADNRKSLSAMIQLRNGWWMVIFILLLAATRPIYKHAKQFLTEYGTPELMLEFLAPALVLLVTYVCLRLRQQQLRDVGLHCNQHAMFYFCIGLAISALQIFSITGFIFMADGLSFDLNPTRTIEAVLSGLVIMFAAVLLEELLFRGFLFQRLLNGLGIWWSQIIFAALFAVGHWDNPGMDGITKLVASVDLALGALIFGLAYIRTRSLALPIGLHLGWNFCQGVLLGFDVSGYDAGGWFLPTINDGAAWITGGEFGLEASIFAVVVDGLLLCMLWRWQGTVATEQPQHQQKDHLAGSAV